MENTLFEQLNLTPEIRRAVEDMGFSLATEIQAESIPLIQQGRDVIGRSQTGTGKTLAFGIPAVEAVDTDAQQRTRAQVLILCPTRELAMQACDELRKLARYMPGVRCADIYGGAPMDRQILRLKTANIVVGTPGRVMDHMRRGTLRLDHVKMAVLDEADEMLSMGFREDIETILQATPPGRQTILFSATMPPDILALTKQYQHDPQMVQVARAQQTVENIEQLYYEVPMGRKMDSLQLLLRYHAPRLSLIFCNTKRMVDDIASYLNAHGFAAEGLHGDMKQSQRTKVMDAFKQGRTAILVATDVAARGIDVNDIETVINYDVPQNPEYYVHRIGRTGRAGKSGQAITLCSGRRQAGELMQIARMAKTTVQRMPLPAVAQVRARQQLSVLAEAEAAIREDCSDGASLLEALLERGYDAATVAAALLQRSCQNDGEIPDIAAVAPPRAPGRATGGYQKISINIGRQSRVAPNHIVGALTGRTSLTGRDIGKIEIYDDETVIAIPESEVEPTIAAMADCKISGRPTVTRRYKGGVRQEARAQKGRDGRHPRGR